MLTSALVVGFDLDMTLADSADGITATLQAAALACPGGEDVRLERAQVWPWVGLPLEDTTAALVPLADPAEVARAYRSRYAAIGVPLTRLLPGAAEAFRAVRSAGGRVLVVSAKAEAGVHAVLAQVGLDQDDLKPDLVAGGLFGGDKGRLLLGDGAGVYVGDHAGDVEAAKVAGAFSVAVATGPQSAQTLHQAGADVILADLGEFPAWLSAFVPGFTR